MHGRFFCLNEEWIQFIIWVRELEFMRMDRGSKITRLEKMFKCKMRFIFRLWLKALTICYNQYLLWGHFSVLSWHQIWAHFLNFLAAIIHSSSYNCACNFCILEFVLLAFILHSLSIKHWQTGSTNFSPHFLAGKNPENQ